MENVKGMLSSAVGGRRIFEMLMEDLRSLGGEEGGLYELMPLCPATMLGDAPQDFVVRAEDHGVPQRRHRVIIVGVRRDVAVRWRARRGLATGNLLRPGPRATVGDVLAGFPALRSGLSREADGDEIWAEIRSLTAEFLAGLAETEDMPEAVADALRSLPNRILGPLHCPAPPARHRRSGRTLPKA